MRALPGLLLAGLLTALAAGCNGPENVTTTTAQVTQPTGMATSFGTNFGEPPAPPSGPPPKR